MVSVVRRWVNVVTFVLVPLVPLPCWPLLLAPQPNSLPSVVTTNVSDALTEISLMFSLSRRWVNIVTSVVVPSPCWPLLLAPQPNSLPSVVNTQVVVVEQPTLAISITSYCAVNVISPLTVPTPCGSLHPIM